MPGENDEVVGSLGRELVSRLAPEELPLYPSLLSQFNGATGARGRKASSDDDLLGFGGAEIITMLTPVILNFTSCFWQALMNEAAESSTQSVLAYVRSHLPGHHEPERVPLSPDQLQLVRAVAEREARRLDIGGKRAGLLADAMVGALVAPPGP
jgi:hypothetical protein